MKKIDWVAKLSSRKFWALGIALVISSLTAFGVDATTTEKVVGIISAIGSCVGYMLAEGIADSGRGE